MVKFGEDLVDPERRSFTGSRAKLSDHRNAEHQLKTSTSQRESYNYSLSLDNDVDRKVFCILMGGILLAYPLKAGQ